MATRRSCCYKLCRLSPLPSQAPIATAWRVSSSPLSSWSKSLRPQHCLVGLPHQRLRGLACIFYPH
eukprot:681556-Prorocentrum_lima.AAC.1